VSTKPLSPAERSATLREAVREITSQNESGEAAMLAAAMAERARINFQAYLKAGFTEAQALQLCKGL